MTLAAIVGVHSGEEDDGAERGGAGRQDVPVNMVSIWNTALEVAVMRLVSVPGRRSAK